MQTVQLAAGGSLLKAQVKGEERRRARSCAQPVLRCDYNATQHASVPHGSVMGGVGVFHPPLNEGYATGALMSFPSKQLSPQLLPPD